MKVGVIVEGRSEFKGLPEIRDQLVASTSATAIQVLFAPYDPNAVPSQIARECESRIRQLVGRGFNRVIVLIDREAQEKECGVAAQEIEREIAGRELGIPVEVVLKNRAFENWLISDPQALREMNARFRITDGMVRKVQPNKADQIDARDFLKRAAVDGRYGKVDDSRRILAKADIARMGLNSRSFRCFLGRLGHPAYRTGSCQPAQA